MLLIATSLWQEWLRLVRRGDYESAWIASDAALLETPDWTLPRHEQRIWRGEPLDGKRVLIRCYHGLGDTIQFLRYLPRVREIAKEVTLWAQPALLPLIRHDRVLPLHDRLPQVEYDVDVEIMELAHVFRSTLETLPREVPYLDAPAARLEGAGRKVGIVWRGGDWDPRRDVPFRLLAGLSGVTLYALQADVSADEQDPRVLVPPERSNLPGLASLMRGLDLVITIDSMPAHLAGALGVPVWLLLHSEPDWRWMEGREDSPWYPTMRLFRQERAGEWAGVMEMVEEALRERP